MTNGDETSGSAAQAESVVTTPRVSTTNGPTFDTNHTPGPWLQSSTVLVCDQDARVIANCTPLVDVPVLAIPINQVAANARLISAAPELLAELQDVLDWALVEKAPLRQQEIDSICAVIAKAKGAV